MMDERNLRALSAMRTDIHRMWLALSAIGKIVDVEKGDIDGELYHWQSGGNSIEGARDGLKEAAHKIEAALVWLSPLEDDDNSSA